jgi:bifunctional DNA-binding transcriptional regulator/antitoxin component of YhaV-PrlF toxin-antitoxin module
MRKIEMDSKIKVSTRGRVLLSKSMRERLGWTSGAKIAWIVDGDNLISRKIGQCQLGQTT